MLNSTPEPLAFFPFQKNKHETLSRTRMYKELPA